MPSVNTTRYFPQARIATRTARARSSRDAFTLRRDSCLRTLTPRKDSIPNITVDDISLMDQTNDCSDDSSRFLTTPVDTPRRGYVEIDEASLLWLDEHTLISTPRPTQKKHLESLSSGDMKWLDPSLDAFPRSFPSMAYVKPASLFPPALDHFSCIPLSRAAGPGVLETEDAVRVNVPDDSTASEPRPPSQHVPPKFPAAPTYEPTPKLRRKDGRHNLRRLYDHETCARRCPLPHLHPRPPPPSLLNSLEYQLTLSVLHELDRRLCPSVKAPATKSSEYSRPSLSDTLGVLLKHLGFPTTVFLCL